MTSLRAVERFFFFFYICLFLSCLSRMFICCGKNFGTHPFVLTKHSRRCTYMSFYVNSWGDDIVQEVSVELQRIKEIFDLRTWRYVMEILGYRAFLWRMRARFVIFCDVACIVIHLHDSLLRWVLTLMKISELSGRY